MKLENLSNSEKRVLFYLVEFDVFDNLDIMKHSYWTKFSTRLGELESKLGYKIAHRKTKTVTDPFGATNYVMTYQALDKQALADVFGGKYEMYKHMAMAKAPKNKLEISENENLTPPVKEIKRESIINS